VRTNFSIAVACAALLAWTLTRAAPDGGAVDRWWRPELDPVVAAPANHKVLIENDDVRVLEVTVPPHTREPLHVHRWPAVIVVETSPHLVEHLQDGATRDLGPRQRGAIWLPVAQGHGIENVDDVPLKAIRVELKRGR
jgi:hypothetical protein